MAELVNPPELIRQGRQVANSCEDYGVLWNWIESLTDALEDVMAHGYAMLSPKLCPRHGLGAKGINCGRCQDDFQDALQSVDGYIP